MPYHHNSMRRWRPLMFIVAVWLLACWYYFRDGSDTYPVGLDLPKAELETPKGGASKDDDGKPAKIPFSPLPEHYPVSSLRPLPSGRPKTKVPNVQRHPRPQETREERQTREQRLAAVRDSFRHSWAGYRDHAWLHDELAPVAGVPRNPFAGWAATLVDALDTLFLMGFRDDFKLAVRACEHIDFSLTEAQNINMFETNIRYLGGFLAAYELSGRKHAVLLRKAREVGELLLSGFDTRNRMPIPRWDWQAYMKGELQYPPRGSLISELGSFSLEFTKLSMLTGDLRYYDAVQRISDLLEEHQGQTKLPGMWPIMVDSAKPAFDGDNAFTLGGMSDSAYEYIPKQYLLLGGRLAQPRTMYEGFMEPVKKHLLKRAMNPRNVPILISGDVHMVGDKGKEKVQHTAKGQHLTCFAGGMVALGSRLFAREADLEVARQMTDGCVWAYNSTASGIGPEIFHYVPCGDVDSAQDSEACRWKEDRWRRAVHDHWKAPKGKEAKDKIADDKGFVDEQITNLVQGKRLPKGMPDVPDRKYILRPEAVESVFVMWRVTGERAWMDKAWDMFLRIEMHTRTELAASALDDVTMTQPSQTNSMESFWFAETLKYFYLIFADWDLVDLDKWVLNTEAHPLKRM